MDPEEKKDEGFIRSLDFFRFTPTKFLEQTVTGAISKNNLKIVKKSFKNPKNKN